MSTSSASSTSSNHSSSSSSSPNTTSAGTPLLLSNREVDWKRDVLVTTTPGDHPTMSPEDGFYASVISNCAQKLLEQNITTMNQLFIPAHRVFGSKYSNMLLVRVLVFFLAVWVDSSSPLFFLARVPQLCKANARENFWP